MREVRGTSVVALMTCVLAGIPGCSPESRPAPQNHVVEIRGFEYHPATIGASAGDTVTWINRDIVPHTATAVDGDWDTGAIAAGASFSLVLTSEAGEYLCTYHPAMRGRLEIE